MLKFTSLTEGRQSTINFIIKTKAKIKTLEADIKGMIEDTKSYLIENKIDKIVTEDGVNVVHIEDTKRAPSFKQVYDSCKDKLTPEVQIVLEKAYEDNYKKSCSINFNY